MLMDSGKNLPCRKSERQLKFRVLDRGVKKHNMFYVLCKKEPDQGVMMRSLMERITLLSYRLVGLPKLQVMVPPDLPG